MKLARRAIASLVLAAFLTGCISQSQLASLASILGTTAASIASIQGNPDLAAKLQTDTAAAVTAIQNWKSGTPTNDVIQVLSIVEDDLALFPQVGPYVPLITLAIGTVQAILALLPTPQGAANARVAHSRVVVPGGAPKNAKEYKQRWNAIVASNPAINQSVMVH